jgi:hypothetical protein
MKVKLMPLFAGTLMVALAIAPLAAQACTGNKDGQQGTGTTQTDSRQGTNS